MTLPYNNDKIVSLPCRVQLISRCLTLAITMLLALPAYAASDTLRCGTRLIQKNDLAIQVREKCGKPVSQEIIGYTLQGNPPYQNHQEFQNTRQREFKIEQWIYGPTRGFYQEIIFEGGRVKKINRIKQ